MDGILDSSLPDEAKAAETAARNAVAANPRDHRAQQALCEWLVRQNRLEDAATALQKAIIWLPDVPSLRIQLAFVQARLGQHAAARQTLAQAAEHLPAGSRMHAEIVETAGAAMAVPSPHEATGPLGHLKPLVIQPTTSKSLPQGRDVALGLDDVASMGVADLVRAGQAARIEQADAEFAEAELPPMQAQATGAPRSRRAPLVWAVAALSALVGVAVWQAASLNTSRVDKVGSEPHLAPARRPTLPARIPASAVKAPPPPFSQAPKPPPKPAAPSPAYVPTLPEQALPIVTLNTITGDPAAHQQASDIGSRIRAFGLVVSDEIVTVPASSTPGITYWFAEDKEAALSISKALGAGFGPVRQARPRQGETTPVPGSITIILPVTGPTNSK